ncbi:basic blue protein isoform X2 [Physcomitrium patens]|uniref:Phytocyanin domain-containing protein n=1 Tax=Physcomitrium patens TaxID=3218 RepID=A0A2K1JRH0_PHYPA|nr:chemocyanin-like [Physcomitrium patens]PNR44131.1 hypothetical protein PHYPA_016515 [Physcomitrium patens]|eukprot:XP_024390532.1 chemocyanin-like [Physcomitrella patens]
MTMGRGSAMLAVAIFLVSAAMGVRGATYTLPGSWVVPTENADIYNVWAQNVSSYLVEGDVIIFQYVAAAHDVVTLGTQAEYDGCDSTTPLNRTQTGNDAIIVKAGINLYICGRNGHCQAGQKVSVTASAANIITPTISPVASIPALSPPLSAPTISPASGAALPAIYTITPAAAPHSAGSVTVPQAVAAATVAAAACFALF